MPPREKGTTEPGKHFTTLILLYGYLVGVYAANTVQKIYKIPQQTKATSSGGATLLDLYFQQLRAARTTGLHPVVVEKGDIPPAVARINTVVLCGITAYSLSQKDKQPRPRSTLHA